MLNTINLNSWGLLNELGFTVRNGSIIQLNFANIKDEQLYWGILAVEFDKYFDVTKLNSTKFLHDFATANKHTKHFFPSQLHLMLCEIVNSHIDAIIMYCFQIERYFVGYKPCNLISY